MACAITGGENSNIRQEVTSSTREARVESVATSALARRVEQCEEPLSIIGRVETMVASTAVESSPAAVVKPRIACTGALSLDVEKDFKECSVYAIGGTMCTAPRSAPLIFLSDNNHADIIQAIERQKVMNQLVREGDIVLIESGDPATEYSQHSIPVTQDLAKKVQVSSWDDPHIVAQCYTALAALPPFTPVPPSVHALAMSRNEALVRNVTARYLALKEGQRLFVIAGGAHLDDRVLDNFAIEPYAIFYFYGQPRTQQVEAAYRTTLTNGITPAVAVPSTS